MLFMLNLTHTYDLLCVKIVVETEMSKDIDPPYHPGVTGLIILDLRPN